MNERMNERVNGRVKGQGETRPLHTASSQRERELIFSSKRPLRENE